MDFYGSFADLQSFKDRFRDHLDNTIYRRFLLSGVTPIIAPSDTSSPPASTANDETDEEEAQRFAALQELYLVIELSVSRTATAWKREQRRKIMRMPRSFIEREGFEWNHQTLLESGPFRTLVMDKARRSDDADFNWYLQRIRYLGEIAKLPEEKPHQLGDDCWIWDIPDPAKDLWTAAPHAFDISPPRSPSGKDVFARPRSWSRHRINNRWIIVPWTIHPGAYRPRIIPSAGYGTRGSFPASSESHAWWCSSGKITGIQLWIVSVNSFGSHVMIVQVRSQSCDPGFFQPSHRPANTKCQRSAKAGQELSKLRDSKPATLRKANLLRWTG